MSDIRIGVGMQRLLLVVVSAVVAAAVASQLPELKRYMKVRQM